MTHLATRQPAALSPTQLMGRLVAPTETIDLMDWTIYWLVRAGGTRHNPGDCAMLSFSKRQSTFKLSYYPKDGNAQVAADLPLSELPQAVADLAGAGFAERTPVPPAKARAQARLNGCSAGEIYVGPVPAKPLSLT